MVNHHPDTNTLLEFAASSLPAAQSVVVSTHLQFCSECRSRLAQLESLGATMFEDAEPVDINPSLFDSVLARLDEVQDDRAANDAKRFNNVMDSEADPQGKSG